jgi:hypothetical protein
MVKPSSDGITLSYTHPKTRSLSEGVGVATIEVTKIVVRKANGLRRMTKWILAR